MSLTGKAKLAGIIGWPVMHSLSPVLHGHWLAEYGIDGAMVPLAAHREDFTAVIDGVRRAGFAGVNVTVPHKESAFAIAHSVDAAAKAAGAVNLLVFRDGKMEGRNTDSLGLAESLREEIGTLERQNSRAAGRRRRGARRHSGTGNAGRETHSPPQPRQPIAPRRWPLRSARRSRRRSNPAHWVTGARWRARPRWSSIPPAPA